MSLGSFGHAYITDYIMNITIELFFSAPSRLSTLLHVHDKHTAKYLVVCQYYIHLSPETIQKLPLGTWKRTSLIFLFLLFKQPNIQVSEKYWRIHSQLKLAQSLPTLKNNK